MFIIGEKYLLNGFLYKNLQLRIISIIINDSYEIIIITDANTEINIINNNCTGRLATGSCTFDVQYNPSAENIRGRPNYGKTDNTITVTATPASGGGALKQIFNVQNHSQKNY